MTNSTTSHEVKKYGLVEEFCCLESYISVTLSGAQYSSAKAADHRWTFSSTYYFI